MKQVLFGNSGTTPSGSVYAPMMQVGITWATETATRSPWPTAGVLRNLVVDVVVAPGAGTSRTFTLRKNGADTALTCTISNTATTARLTGTDVAVAVGDLVALQHTASGSPASTAGVRWSLEFEGTTAKESGYAHAFGTANNVGSPRAAGVFASNTALATATTNIANIVAAAGTVTRVTVYKDTSITGGTGFTFYLNKNGVRQDGTAGSVNTACALFGTASSATATFSLALVAGDLVYLEAVATGSFGASPAWSAGTTFVATTDGEAQLCGGTTAAVSWSTGTTQYATVAETTGTLGTVETSFNLRASGGVTSIQLSKFRLALVTAPGASKSRTFDLRKNATSPGPTLTIADAATSNSDLVNTMTVADGDLWNLRSVPTSTPAASPAAWSCVAFITPPAVERTDTFVWIPV